MVIVQIFLLDAARKNTNFPGPTAEEVEDSFHRSEPNTAAIRHYLLSDPKSFPSVLSESERTVVAKQARSSFLENNKLYTWRKDGKRVIYLETVQRRAQLLEKTHQ